MYGTKMGYRLMSVTYNNLWKLLIDRGMNKTQMRLKAGISTATLAKMSRGEPVNLSIITKVCNALGCHVGDVVDCVQGNTSELQEV